MICFSEFEEECLLEPLPEIKGYNKNLRGFISLRQYIENGEEIKK